MATGPSEGPVDVDADNINPAATKPIAIRWDSPQGGTKLTIPIDGADGEARLAQLLEDCQPATFGYHNKDVLDETYRKAAKMDRSAFSPDFCPYELGIIDTIAQVLLPNAKKGGLTGGVQAELYKLNVHLSLSLSASSPIMA